MEDLFFMLSIEISDNISFLLSIFGSTIAIISLYYSRLKIGRLRGLPIKLYIAEPMNLQGGRAVKLVMPITFSNNGAVTRAVNDLRVRVVVPGEKDLLLDWIYEYKELSITESTGVGHFPAQPTIKSYESINRIYGFQSDADGCAAVDAMEKHEDAQKYSAYLEYYNRKRKWCVLHKFTFAYNGRHTRELDYANINE